MSDASSETPVPVTNFPRSLPRLGKIGLRRGLLPRAVARADVARGRPADARGRGQPGQRGDLLLGPARAGRRASTTSTGSTGSSTCCTGPASPSTSPLRRPRRPPGSSGATRRHGRSPGRARCSAAARATRSAPARRRTGGTRPGSPSGSPSGTPIIRRWPCGTSTTSTAGEPRSATARSRRRRSVAGSATGTGRWRRSTRRGARRSGASATATGPRSSRRGSRRPASTPPTARLPALLERRVPGVLPRRARHPAPAQPRRAGHHELHDRQLQGHRLLAVGTRGRRGRQRPLPAGRAGRQPHRPGDGRGPDPLGRRRATVAAHGALHQRGQLAAPQPRQGARRAAPQQLRPHRPRRRRGAVLPVAGLAVRRREVPLGDAAARRHRHPGLA